MEWSNDREMIFSPDATNYKFLNLTSETTYELRLITLIMGSCEQRTSKTVNFTTIGKRECERINACIKFNMKLKRKIMILS